jgi:hypothetical protein
LNIINTTFEVGNIMGEMKIDKLYRCI